MAGTHFSWNKLIVWVGGITAILTLFFSLRDFTGFFTSNSSQRAAVETLLASAALQQSHGQYEPAWNDLAQADTMNQLGDRVTTAREDLAMRWLEDGHGTGPERSLGALADLVSPVLSKGAATASGRRKADLLAHLGWAEFYRWRDGARATHPDEYYRQALGVDPADPFAHAMLAHWMLWNAPAIDSAQPHFTIALKADSARPFVRSLEIGGYSNLRSPAGNTELIRVASEMAHGHEAVPEVAQGALWDLHWSCFVGPLTECDAAKLRGALSAADHLAAWNWAMASGAYPSAKGVQYQFVTAHLEEAAGNVKEAAAAYRAIEPQVRQYDTMIRQRVAEGIKRTASH